MRPLSGLSQSYSCPLQSFSPVFFVWPWSSAGSPACSIYCQHSGTERTHPHTIKPYQLDFQEVFFNSPWNPPVLFYLLQDKPPSLYGDWTLAGWLYCRSGPFYIGSRNFYWSSQSEWSRSRFQYCIRGATGDSFSKRSDKASICSGERKDFLPLPGLSFNPSIPSCSKWICDKKLDNSLSSVKDWFTIACCRLLKLSVGFWRKIPLVLPSSFFLYGCCFGCFPVLIWCKVIKV